MVKQRTVGLVAFIRGSSNPADKIPGCASFDHHYGGCLFADNCSVQDGEICTYFETVVLPTAIDIGLVQELSILYRKHVGIDDKPQYSDVNTCNDCGIEIRRRQRFCPKCRRRRSLESKRKFKRKDKG